MDRDPRNFSSIIVAAAVYAVPRGEGGRAKDSITRPALSFPPSRRERRGKYPRAKEIAGGRRCASTSLNPTKLHACPHLLPPRRSGHTVNPTSRPSFSLVLLATCPPAHLFSDPKREYRASLFTAIDSTRGDIQQRTFGTRATFAFLRV